ncbi:MAG: PAS domain-containing hybrid sensor histidine kinase/response regulator [Pseudomonadota bacterium]|nr:PAS domain-containing hybrid sensor histidine kinase/response regulator [Pseudomonadota bacterium]
MIDGWTIIAAAFAYLGFLFAVAYLGDRQATLRPHVGGRPAIYALSLAVYCTSWTFFGSVGLSATTGLDFLPVYLGPIIMIGAGWPLLRRIVHLSKNQNITSIADFIAARYGKSPALAAIVTVIAVAGTVPYIALQLKAVSLSVTTLLGPVNVAQPLLRDAPLPDLAFIIAVTMAAFAILFGTRHIDATEHQEGLMLAIATESLVKLVAFIAVGCFVTFYMFDGIGDLFARARAQPEISGLFSRGFAGGTWLTITFLSLICVLLLPRQFHVAVVENNSDSEIRRAAWLFPLYLVAINLFVVPIAIAGLLTFPRGTADADMFVLALPMSAGSDWMSLIAFVGGLSAATAMVIVASVALAIMISNDLMVPLLLHRGPVAATDREDMSGLLLTIRRSAIFLVLVLAYVFYRMVGDTVALASIGLLAFAAITQFAPAFFGGLIWRRATARGAIAGIVVGFGIWTYTLLLPFFVKSGWFPAEILAEGPFGVTLLRPQMLFNMEFDSLTHGVVWSLLFNVLAYVTVSLLRSPEPIERLQANAFIQDDFARPPAPSFRLWRSSITVGELQRTVARYLGEERAARSFAEFASSTGNPSDPQSEADIQLLRFAEHLLASAIGAASSRLVLSLLLRRRSVGVKSALKLLDDASEAIQYNRDLLQSALDQVRQGISVFDRDMRLICWNRQFREILDLPPELGRVGVPLDEIVRYLAGRGDLGTGPVEDIVSDRVHKFVVTQETFQQRIGAGDAGPVIEIRTNLMPQGGIVATFSDITERVDAAEALARANETLERRVHERTAELTRVNSQLAVAKAKADEANLDKTRFLAAASHDILQPLNAARLYVTTLVERKRRGEDGRLIRNVDSAMEAVEEILNALLDISRLDTGAMKPEMSVFGLPEFLKQLQTEFEPLAGERGLELRVISQNLHVRSDRRLLRRVLQNLISNAVKYTETGRVVVGCRRRGERVELQVHDTGPGIPVSEQRLIFKEFQRLASNSAGTRGLGLGLSIVERIGRMLEHPVGLASQPGRGSVFSVTLPLARAEEAKTLDQAGVPSPGRIAGTCVLCVDNEPAILDGMEVLLSSWGCRVVKAVSRAEALQRLRAGAIVPDIVLADYHLDGDTGVAVVRFLREQFGPDLAAVVITADRSPEVQELVRSEGLHILRKPLRPASLRAVMAQSRLRHAAAAE